MVDCFKSAKDSYKGDLKLELFREYKNFGVNLRGKQSR
jgi:hypothetical protein